MVFIQRPSLWHHIRSWDRKSDTAGVKRLVTGPLLVTDKDLAHHVMVQSHLYEEQSAFVRTQSYKPMPFETRNVVIRGLMDSIGECQRDPESIPKHIFPGQRGVVTQSWGTLWMRHLFRDALAADRSEVINSSIDWFVKHKILGDDIGGRLRRVPPEKRDKLHGVLGSAIVAAAEDPKPHGDLIDVVGKLDFDLPPPERGELYVRLLASVISFTGTALEWAVNIAAGDRDFRAAMLAGEDARPFLLESQRLYPTAWRLVRTAETEHEIGGHQVAVGDEIIISTASLHRSDTYWEQAKEFRPCRWADPAAARDRAFMPFGRGRGMCPGREVAMESVQESLWWIFQNYQVSVRPRPWHTPYVRSITAPPRMRVRARRRTAPADGSRALQEA